MENNRIYLFPYLLALLMGLNYSYSDVSGKTSNEPEIQNQQHSIQCTDEACQGTYTGPEFINGSDVAHQFSNKMSEQVGDQLKALYAEEKYAMVNMEKIQMTTKGMGSGNVVYTLVIPFDQVQDKCSAYTSFDHVGGWNHAPALSARKKQLNKALLPNDKLNISPLKTTPEGLQEYWIQWRNKDTQSDCGTP